MNHKDQDIWNREALINPQIGDYWHEMFCPYFLIVDIRDDVYIILDFIRSRPHSAYVEHKDGWSIDFSKAVQVNKEWIEKQVKYSTMDSFVANVVRKESWSLNAQKWRELNDLPVLSQDC